jgi:hypothetical protein
MIIATVVWDGMCIRKEDEFTHVLALAIVAASCRIPVSDMPHRPVVWIGIERRGTDTYLRFQSCIDEDKVLDLKGLSIAEFRDGTRASKEVCSLSWRDITKPSIKREWRFGSAVPGYVMKLCEPLVPGKAYEVRVAAAGDGTAVFRVDKAGTIEILKDSCEK